MARPKCVRLAGVFEIQVGRDPLRVLGAHLEELHPDLELRVGAGPRILIHLDPAHLGFEGQVRRLFHRDDPARPLREILAGDQARAGRRDVGDRGAKQREGQLFFDADGDVFT